MNFTEEDKRELLSNFNYGITLALIRLMAEFIYENEKAELAGKLNQFIDEFGHSLNEEEQKEFKTQTTDHLKSKIEEFKEKVITHYGQEGVDEAMEVLSQSPFLKGK